jgi:hypothetical protein
MIISDLSVLETVEESANIQGGSLNAPLFTLFSQVQVSNNFNGGVSASASASASVFNSWALDDALTRVAINSPQFVASLNVVFAVNADAHLNSIM